MRFRSWHAVALVGAVLVIGSLAALLAPGAPAPQAGPQAASALAATPCPQEGFDCYEGYYQRVVRQDGIPAAFADLKARYPESGYIRSQCHPITHVIGREAAREFATPAEAYAQGDGFCWSGYHHGVMEEMVARTGGAVMSDLDSLCAAVPGKERYSFDYYNCVHGLGHGIMSIMANDLPGSLQACDALTGWWEQASCWSGAFMENVIIDGKGEYTAWLRPEEPLFPCTTVADKYQSTCYLMQTSYMLKVTGEDFPRVFALCATTGAHADTCYQSLGRDASGHSVSDIARTKASCLLGPDENSRRHCIIGAVKDFISYYHSDAQAKELCAALPAELQETCLSTAAEYYKSF